MSRLVELLDWMDSKEIHGERRAQMLEMFFGVPDLGSHPVPPQVPFRIAPPVPPPDVSASRDALAQMPGHHPYRR